MEDNGHTDVGLMFDSVMKIGKVPNVLHRWYFWNWAWLKGGLFFMLAVTTVVLCYCRPVNCAYGIRLFGKSTQVDHLRDQGFDKKEIDCANPDSGVGLHQNHVSYVTTGALNGHLITIEVHSPVQSRYLPTSFFQSKDNVTAVP